MRGTPPKTTDGSENGKKGEGNSLGDPDREDDRCPICLTPPDPQDQATPESCDHLFCLRCILTWGQTVPSCPVDRRPFSVIYKLDANLGTVKIPVKQKTSRVELLTGCCEKKREETKSCTSSRRPVEKTQQGTLCAEAKEHPTRKCKSPGSKCNQENSDLRKRKLMDLCGSQLLGPRITSLHPEGGTTAALTHCYEELFREDYGDSTVMQKNCRLELQNWPWVYATAAIPASHLSLRPCSRYELSPRTLPFRPSSSRCNSAAGRQTRCFEFPIAECIITCTRGGESKAPRPSSSRASKNQTETSTAKRSTRNSRSEESRPAPDAALSLSHESGSDSPTVDSARQGVASRPQQKRAGKRNTKQRAGAWRRQRRKPSQESHCSPEDSGSEQPKEEEEQKETDDSSGSHISGHQNANSDTSTSNKHTDQEDLISSDTNSQQEMSCPLTADHNSQEGSPPGTPNDDSRQEVSCPTSPEDISQEDISCPTTPEDISQEDVSCPITTDESSQQEHEEAEDFPQANDSVSGNELSGTKTVSEIDSIPPSSAEELQEETEEHLNNQEVENLEMPANEADEDKESLRPGGEDPISSGQQEEAESEGRSENTVSSSCDQPMEVEMDLMKNAMDKDYSEAKAKANMDELSQDSESTAFSNQSSGDPSRSQEVNNDHPNGSLTDNYSDGLMEPERASGHVDVQDQEFSCTQEASNGESLSEDNTDLVPMECDSPSSEHNEPQSEQDRGNESTCAPATQAPDEEKRSEPTSPHRTAQDRKEPRQRRSRFHSPSTTWSPKRDSKREQWEGDRRSRSRERSTTQSSRRRSRSRSRDRDSDRGRDGSRGEGSRRNRSRERRSRRSSRSRSRSRNRAFGGRGSSPERGESGRQSSPRRERRPYNSWRNRWGNDQSRREDQDKLSGATGREGGDLEKGGAVERLADRSQGHNSDGVRDKGDRDSGFEGAPRWEDLRGESSWNSEGGYGRGRGRGGLRDEPSQNRWQSRNSFSGTTNSSGNDSYSRFNENQSDKRRGEGELSETLLDRSGWSSASSRAVRRTLPADVQSYYSRRGRNSGGPGGGWNRQEEETPGQDPHHNEAHALPRGECSQLPLATQPQPQPMAILQFPMSAHVPPMTLAPPPFSIPPQVPVPIHSAMPLYQGLPPPPPPPPPLQQADGQPPRQAVGSVPVQGANRFCAPGLLGHPKAPGGLGQPAVPLPSSTTNTQPTSKDGNKVEAYADSSKKEKKLQIQERAVQEVKTAIKPYYQNKDISKDEYKEIVRKAVEKVCHSKSGEVNSGKVANLVKAYVDKYKHARKNKPEVQSKS